MTLDLLIAILLTAAGALVIWALAISVPGSNRRKAVFAIALIAWFSIAVVFAATGIVGANGFGTTGVGLGVLLPVLAFAWLGPRWPALRNALTGIPIPVFVAVNTVRVLGFFFVISMGAGAAALHLRAERRLGRCLGWRVCPPRSVDDRASGERLAADRFCLEPVRLRRSGRRGDAWNVVGGGFAALPLRRRVRTRA